MITVGVSNACQKLKNGKVQNVSRLIQEGTMGAMPPPPTWPPTQHRLPKAISRRGRLASKMQENILAAGAVPGPRLQTALPWTPRSWWGEG